MSEDDQRNLRAWGGPLCRGVIRAAPEDFRVIEELGHAPTGDGEHWWVLIEKRERNTVDVANALAKIAGVPSRRVGFGGLKDRNAVTRQYFSIHLPGGETPDWHAWEEPGVRVLEAARSARKIQRGRLSGNHFELVVRELDGDIEALGERLANVRDHGVPNGFGEQRFGGNNIARAHALFRGEMRRKPSKSKRGFYLSAARSLIFNHVLIERIRRGDWHRLIDGDLAILDGTRSFFAADPDDDDQVRRCDELDIHPSGPLAGEGESPAGGEAARIENAVLESHAELARGLARFGMEQQRRALRMKVSGLEWEIDGTDLHLSFSLGTGSYATSVLRELVDYREDKAR